MPKNTDVLQPYHILLLNWWESNNRAFPWRKKDVTPYQILITEMMLWKTRAETVDTIWHSFFRDFPDIQTLSASEEKFVAKIIAPLGLKRRGEYMIQAASSIVGHYGGNVPSDKESLMMLPGVGEYVASAVRCFAFGEDEAIYDANMRRIMSRMYGCETDDEGAKCAKRLLPSGWARQWNYALLDLAAMVCRWKPACDECPITSICMMADSK